MALFDPPRLTVREMAPADVTMLALNGADVAFLGAPAVLDAGYGAWLLEAGPAWVVERRDGRLLAACGFSEHFPTYATCWALLAQGLGADHLAMTRIVRERMQAAPYLAIEALVRADHVAGDRWARLLGMEFAFLARHRGPKGEDYRVFEMVRREVTP